MGDMADYYRDDDYDFDDPIQHRGPHRVFGLRHPLGNPAEVVGFLAQGDRWVSALGPVDIVDMDPGHAQNAAALILENAERIALAYQIGEPGLHLESELASEAQAKRLVINSALFRGLITRAAFAESKPSWAK